MRKCSYCDVWAHTAKCCLSSFYKHFGKIKLFWCFYCSFEWVCHASGPVHIYMGWLFITIFRSLLLTLARKQGMIPKLSSNREKDIHTSKLAAPVYIILHPKPLRNIYNFFTYYPCNSVPISYNQNYFLKIKSPTRQLLS